MPGARAALDHESIRDLLAAAVREAGTVALRTFQRELKSWTKGRSSPVSEADLAVNTLLRTRLLAAHAIGWLSEETEDDPARLDERDVWVVDPIDGTRGYIAGLPDWAISAALVSDGRPVVAALYAPVNDALYLAVAGGGATRNGTALEATTGGNLVGARVAGPRRRLERLAEIEPGIEAVPPMSSLALRLARVAGGTFDAAFAGPNSHDWDLAAADLLVHEAGGMLTTLTGHSPIYNRPEPVHGALIAAGRARHATLLTLLRNRLAEFA